MLVELAMSMFYLFGCILPYMLFWRSVGRSNFDSGLHNLIMFIRKVLYTIYYTQLGGYTCINILMIRQHMCVRVCVSVCVSVCGLATRLLSNVYDDMTLC